MMAASWFRKLMASVRMRGDDTEFVSRIDEKEDFEHPDAWSAVESEEEFPWDDVTGVESLPPEDEEGDGALDGLFPDIPTEPSKWDLPLYWTMAMAEPTYSVVQPDMSGKEIDTVGLFLARLALAIRHRGVLLDGDAIVNIIENMEPGKATALLSEPWMSRTKRKASQAIELGRVITGKAVEAIGFERLVDAGLSPTFARTEEELHSRVFAGDLNNLKIWAGALRKLRTPLGETMASSIDYVAACLGDRSAMLRVAERIDVVTDEKLQDGPLLKGAIYHELVITADVWRRLAYARLEGRSDAIEVFREKFAAIRLSMTGVWSGENVIENLVMESPSKRARISHIELAQHRNGLLDGILKKVGPTGSDDRDSAAAFRQVLEEQETDKPTSTDKRSKEFQILDNIEGGDGNEAVKNYGGLLRPLPARAAPDPDFLHTVLMREFPWMADANRVAAMASALTARTPEGVFRLPPMVLVGPPGVGKSRWARRVCEIAATPMHMLTLSGVANSKSVVGNERGWMGARPSLPTLAFAATNVANPVIVIDEVDKVAVSGPNGDAIAGFLPMLTKETSGRYPDPYLLGKLDLSRVSFVFTANSLSGLSQPFLDRVEAITVGRPSARDYPGIVNTMLAEIMSEFSFTDDEKEAFADDIRAEGLSSLERGESMRSVEAAIRERLSSVVWSPKGTLTVVK